MNFELFVSRRYLFSRREGIFTFLTALIAVSGVAVGVAALITTLGIMTGFQTDIKERVLGAQSHILITGDITENSYKQAVKEIEKLPYVSGAAPNIDGQAILNFNNSSLGAVLRGLDPEQEKKINNLMSSFEEGSLPSSADGSRAVAVGVELARTMGIDTGDEVVLISPSSIASSVPKMQKFTVTGLIKTGYYEFDTTMVYTDLKSAEEFLDLDSSVTGIAVKLTNIDKADKIAARIRGTLKGGYDVKTFSQMNSTLYAALKLEKLMMFIILSLIILVAALNIASNLILLGTEKLKDIGILRAMGAGPVNISKIFIYEGLLIGTLGMATGVILGLLLCWTVSTFNFVQLPGDIFYLTKIPVKLQWTDVLAVAAGTYFLCLAAALYPAARAAGVNPADAVRCG